MIKNLKLTIWICLSYSLCKAENDTSQVYIYSPSYNNNAVIPTTSTAIPTSPPHPVWPKKKHRKKQHKASVEEMSDEIEDILAETNQQSACVPPDDVIEDELPVEQRLMRRLLKNYERSVRPVKKADDTVIVRMGITITQIFQMDEKNQVLVTNVWLDQEWDDTFLTWDPNEYGGLEVLRLPCHKLWLPDIVLYNNAAEYTDGLMPANVMIHFSGNVFWPVPTKLQSSCKVDVTYFPFDEQLCTMKFGSWTYDGFQVDMVNRTTDVDLTNYVANGEWELISIKIQRNVVYYACCPEPFPDVTFIIHIHRRMIYYLYNVIFPCIMMSALTLLVFCLPPDSGEKITLGITVLLAFSVFLLRMGENLPETSEYIPLLSIYLTVVMGLTSISVIMTVLVLNLHFRGPSDSPVPGWLRFLFVGSRGRAKGIKELLKRRKGHDTFNCKQSLRFVDKYINSSETTLEYRYQQGSSLRDTIDNLAQELKDELDQAKTATKATGYSSPRASFVHDFGNVTHTFQTEYTGGDSAEEDNKDEHVTHDFNQRYNLSSRYHQSSTSATSTARHLAYEGVKSNSEILSAMKKIIERYEKDDNEEEMLFQWRQVAVGVDRILFVIFLIATTTATLVILIVAPITKFI